jgi:UDP-2,3-diacylglucosamine pyrophosphatase LpxH
LKVVVVSDVHLGYSCSDRDKFGQFLDHLLQDKDATHFILLGDIVDMWRRDASGVFLESHSFLEQILALAKRMQVTFLAGNHDYHLRCLVNDNKPGRFYPIQFLPEPSWGVENDPKKEHTSYALDDDDSGCKYLFKHGWEYDPEQHRPVMESMCHVMSDEAGNVESAVWNSLTQGPKEWLVWLKSLAEPNLRQQIRNVQIRPEDRLKDSLDKVEQNACKDVKPNQVLVFGHTHRPFVSRNNLVANTGSWVTDAATDYFDTYIELSNGKPHLFTFDGQKEITDLLRKDICDQ